MASLSDKQQLQAVKLYKSGLTTPQLAVHFKVSIGAIFYTLRKAGIKRRSVVESRKIRFERSPLSYQIKTNLTREEEDLKLSAIMLYWAEGYKAGHSSIDFANSDPDMIRLFSRFLREICGVQSKRLRGKLYCYEGQDVSKLVRFWSRAMNVPENQFTKPYVIKAREQGKRGARMLHGLVHICYSDRRLLQQMKNWIEVWDCFFRT